jgi:ribosome maturation factor RimP
MEMDVQESTVRTHVEALAEANGLILVDLRLTAAGRRGGLLRILVDRPGRITLDECADFSRLVGDLLDREMVLDIPYVLEVGSPGVGRRLETAEDWRRTVGRQLRIELADSVVFEGLLESYDGERLAFSEGRSVLASDVVSAVEVI